MKQRNSYSLIELLMVLSIILILCTLGIPYLTNHKKYLIEHELSKIQVILLYLHQRAMASGTDQILVVDQHTNSYWFTNKTGTVVFKLNPELHFDFLSWVYGPPGDPVGPITQAITFPTQKERKLYNIILFSDGKCTPGTLYVLDKQKILMGALTAAVSQVFYIRKYLYKQEQWLLLSN